MQYKADLHIHTDFYPDVEKWHGSSPAMLIPRITQSDLDVAALIEHERTLSKDGQDRFARYFEGKERLEAELAMYSDKARRKISLLMGIEINVLFENVRYHVGHIFEEDYHRGNLPEIPEPNIDLQDFKEQFAVDHPGVTMLFHPTSKDIQGSQDSSDVTQALMESDLIDGVEIFNAAMVINGKRDGNGIGSGYVKSKRGLQMFLDAKKKQPEVAALGFSDDHNGNLIGTVASSFEATDHDGLFDAIRRGSTRPVISQPEGKVRSMAHKLKKNVRHIGRTIEIEY